MKNKLSLPVLAALGAVFIWALAPMLLKSVVEKVDVTTYLALRFFVSTLIFLPLLPQSLKLARKVPIKTLVYFASTVILNFVLQAYALKGLPASWYIVLFSLAPLMTYLVLRQDQKSGANVGFAVCILGTLLFIRLNELSAIGFWPFLFLFLSLLIWVALSQSMVRLQKDLNDKQISTLMNFVGFVSFSIIWSLNGSSTLQIGMNGAVLILIVAILMPLAFTLYSFALRLRPRFAVLSQYLEPALGCLFAFLFMGEAMDFRQWLGVGMLMAGLAWSELAPLVKKKPGRVS